MCAPLLLTRKSLKIPCRPKNHTSRTHIENTDLKNNLHFFYQEKFEKTSKKHIEILYAKLGLAICKN